MGPLDEPRKGGGDPATPADTQLDDTQTDHNKHKQTASINHDRNKDTTHTHWPPPQSWFQPPETPKADVLRKDSEVPETPGVPNVSGLSEH